MGLTSIWKQNSAMYIVMIYLPRYLTGGLGPRFLLPFGGVTGSAGSEGNKEY